jgi:uncharacterized protein with GYD domain
MKDGKLLGKKPERIKEINKELGSRGTIKIVSMAAIPIDEFIASIKKR